MKKQLVNLSLSIFFLSLSSNACQNRQEEKNSTSIIYSTNPSIINDDAIETQQPKSILGKRKNPDTESSDNALKWHSRKVEKNSTDQLLREIDSFGSSHVRFLDIEKIIHNLPDFEELTPEKVLKLKNVALVLMKLPKEFDVDWRKLETQTKLFTNDLASYYDKCYGLLQKMAEISTTDDDKLKYMIISARYSKISLDMVDKNNCNDPDFIEDFAKLYVEIAKQYSAEKKQLKSKFYFKAAKMFEKAYIFYGINECSVINSNEEYKHRALECYENAKIYSNDVEKRINFQQRINFLQSVTCSEFKDIEHSF